MKFLRYLIGLVAAACVSHAAQLTPGLPLIAIGPTNITTTNAAGFRAAIGAAASASVPPPAVVGNTLHVEEHGDDGTGTGSVDYPFRTLTAAFVAKVAGDEIVMGPGTFEFEVTAAAGSTAEANRLVSNFAVRGAGRGVTFVSVVPRGVNEHNRVLSVPASTPVTNVLFSGFTLDGNDSDYVWDVGGKLDWILQGQNITVENVEVIDWGGHATLEAFNPLFQSATNYVVRNSMFRLPGSVNVTGPTAEDSSRGLFEGNVIEGYNVGFGMAGMSSWNVITGNRTTNITTAGFIYDTAGAGEIWGNTISRNRFSSAGDGVLVGLGAHLDFRIFGNEFFGSNRGINLTNYNGDATNYFLRPVVTENTFYISSGRNIYGTGVTNGAFFLNIGRSTSDNSVSGSANFGAFNEDRTGTLYTGIPNTLQGAGGGITLDASGFNGNLAVTDDTVQEVAQKLDDLVAGVGSGTMTTVKEGDVQVGGADIVTLDFGSGFDLTESPDTEMGIALDLSEVMGGGDLTLTGNTPTVSANAVALATDTTGNYVATVAGTANEVEVSGSGAENAAVTVGLPDDVTIGDDLTVTGDATAATFTATGAGAGAVLVADTDQSNYGGLVANATTTTDTILNLPAAPFAGYVQFTVSNTTNWVPSQVAFGVGLLGSDVSHNPVDVDTKAELDTALGGTDLALATGDTYTGTHDFGGATLEVPNSDDPDVSTTGQMAWDTDGWMRVYDGANQVAVARTIETIQATIVAPNDLADAVRDAALIWSNESGMSFVITGWKAWSGTDDTTLNIEETDADGANNATVDAVEIATNGTGVFTGADTTITAATIENGHLLWLDFDDTDTPTYVKITIYGYYNADVN